MISERTPPHSDDAERGTLGAILLDGRRCYDLARAARLDDAAFYVPANRAVWGAIGAVAAHGAPIDVLTVTQTLREAGQLESVGGAIALHRIIDATPTAAHAEHYIGIVRRLAELREIAAYAADLAARVSAPDANPQAIAAVGQTAFAHLAAGPDGNTGEVVDAATVVDLPEAPQHEPLFADLLDVGDKLSIIGKSKTRKTFFGFQLAMCAASGRSFLAWAPVRPLRVLYCNYEIRTVHAMRRLWRMGRAMRISGIDLGDRLQVHNLRGTDTPVDALLSAIRRHRAELVIIDPLYKVIRDGDENKSEVIKPILAAFDRLAESTKAAISYIHHDTKGAAGDRDNRDRGSGSGVMNRDFDACLLITEQQDAPDQVVVAALCRNYKEPPPFVAEWTEDGCFAVRDDIAPAPKSSRTRVQESPYKDRIRDARKADPSATAREIARRVGCSHQTATKWMDVDLGADDGA